MCFRCRSTIQSDRIVYFSLVIYLECVPCQTQLVIIHVFFSFYPKVVKHVVFKKLNITNVLTLMCYKHCSVIISNSCLQICNDRFSPVRINIVFYSMLRITINIINAILRTATFTYCVCDVCKNMQILCFYQQMSFFLKNSRSKRIYFTCPLKRVLYEFIGLFNLYRLFIQFAGCSVSNIFAQKSMVTILILFLDCNESCYPCSSVHT